MINYMIWNYRIRGDRVTVRVFLGEAYCGTLMFTLAEFTEIKNYTLTCTHEVRTVPVEFKKEVE